MFIKLFSDIHLEFGRNNIVPSSRNFFIRKLPTDENTVLCLAGDICSIEINNFHESFLNSELSKRFRKVLYIPGNHEYYNGCIETTDKKLQEYCDKHGIVFMQKKSIEIDDVVFIGATLWTRMSNVNPIIAFKIMQYMHDYKKIRIGTQSDKLTIDHVDLLHKDHLMFIENELKIHSGKKCIVMTHHAPSYQCIDEYYKRNSDVNNAFYSDLDDLILKYEPNFWFFGHSHTATDFKIGNTRLINNSIGYIHEQTGFDPEMLIQI
jgi:Icc-related predicted phosphoesterase